jgi:plasminogen activator inhibitor 1 RNA-binding protein
MEEISATQTAGEESAEEKPKDAEHTEDRETGDEKENQNDAPNGPTEEQPKLMTLDEWKALQQPRQKPVFNIRKPGEGEDPSQWQKMMLIKKEKEEEEEEEEDEEEEYDCPQRAGRQKQVLEIDFHFTDSRRGGNERRGGRGGRGGGGDRGGRDGDRGERGPREAGTGPREPTRSRGGFKNFRGGRGGRDDRPTRQAAPKVDDVNDFPSLG